MKYRIFAQFECRADAEDAISSLTSSTDGNEVRFEVNRHSTSYINHELNPYETAASVSTGLSALIGAAICALMGAVGATLDVIPGSLLSSTVLLSAIGALFGALVGYIAGSGSADPRLKELASEAKSDEAILVTVQVETLACKDQIERIFSERGAGLSGPGSDFTPSKS